MSETLTPPPIQNPIAEPPSGLTPRVWARWFDLFKDRSSRAAVAPKAHQGRRANRGSQDRQGQRGQRDRRVIRGQRVPRARQGPQGLRVPQAHRAIPVRQAPPARRASRVCRGRRASRDPPGVPSYEENTLYRHGDRL